MNGLAGVRKARSVHLALTLLVILSALWTHGCKSVLLDERFHDDRLVNWMVIDDPDTVEGPSEWRVGPDGWLEQRSNIWGRRGDFLGRWFGTSIVAGSENWSDYRFSVRARPGDNDGFGVVFRYLGPESFYRLLFIQDGISGGPITILDKREGSEYTELWSQPRGYKVGTVISIEIVVNGSSIRASVDGRELVEWKDSSYRRGKIGLFCHAQSEQAFDDVIVTAL